MRLELDQRSAICDRFRASRFEKQRDIRAGLTGFLLPLESQAGLSSR